MLLSELDGLKEEFLFKIDFFGDGTSNTGYCFSFVYGCSNFFIKLTRRLITGSLSF